MRFELHGRIAVRDRERVRSVGAAEALVDVQPVARLAHEGLGHERRPQPVRRGESA